MIIVNFKKKIKNQNHNRDWISDFSGFDTRVGYLGTRNQILVKYQVLDFRNFGIGYPKISDWVSADTRFDSPNYYFIY